MSDMQQYMQDAHDEATWPSLLEFIRQAFEDFEGDA